MKARAIPTSRPAASVVLPDVPMFGDSTVFTFAVSGGVLLNLSDNVGLVGEPAGRE